MYRCGGKYNHIFRALAEPFPPKVVKHYKKGGKTMNYITARTTMNRLDEVLGPENWWDEYHTAKENSVECRLTIRLPDHSTLTKCDAGGNAGMADEGDDDKSGVSDALKRAAVKFGVGRYLYGDGIPHYRIPEPEPEPAGEEEIPDDEQPRVTRKAVLSFKDVLLSFCKQANAWWDEVCMDDQGELPAWCIRIADPREILLEMLGSRGWTRPATPDTEQLYRLAAGVFMREDQEKIRRQWWRLVKAIAGGQATNNGADYDEMVQSYNRRKNSEGFKVVG